MVINFHLVSDHSLLAILLGKTATCKSLATIDSITTHFPNWQSLYQSSRQQWLDYQLNINDFDTLAASKEANQRFLQESLNNTPLQHSEAVKRYCQQWLKPLTSEAFCLLLLDCQFHFLHMHQISQQCVNAVQLPLRDILKTVLNYSTRYIFLAHNHPSGSTTISRQDIDTTIQLQKALKLINVEVLDHLIIAHEQVLSMREAQLFEQI